jgi:hypothetical protein
MRLVLCLLALAACQSVQPSGDALPPTHPRPRPVEEAPAKLEPAKDQPKAAGDAKVDAAPTADAMSDAELLAIAMGVDPATVKPATPSAQPTPAAGTPAAAAAGLPLPVAPAAPAAPAVAPWTPGTRLEGSWGVRVVSIVADAQPPRAILGLPDGQEVVVEPGAFIESEKLVVTAIGREAVQVAHVVPVGDRVRIEDRTLQPLYAPAPRTPSP